jgi:CBS domain-containing protein
MNAKVQDLMTALVMTATPHQTVGHVRDLMRMHQISCLPIVDPNHEPVGIVTLTDLTEKHKDGTPISHLMSETVLTVPRYAEVSLAARIMRNHHTHHVVVTQEKKVVGIISSFDLLRLIEDHRFVMRNAPSTPRHPLGTRKKAEGREG